MPSQALRMSCPRISGGMAEKTLQESIGVTPEYEISADAARCPGSRSGSENRKGRRFMQ